MRKINLTKEYAAFVDDEDYDALTRFKWHAAPSSDKKHVYAARRDKDTRKLIYMHRIIAGATADMVVDHIDGHGLNNQRHNLRIGTQKQNSQNRTKSTGRNYTSRFHGVRFIKSTGTWAVVVTINGFDSEEKAARIYDEIARKYKGEFAKTNFPEQEGNI